MRFKLENTWQQFERICNVGFVGLDGGIDKT